VFNCIFGICLNSDSLNYSHFTRGLQSGGMNGIKIKLKVPKKIMINQNRSYPNNFLMETKKIPKKILRIMISLQKRQLIKMINNLKNRVSRPQSKSSKKFLSLKRVSFLKELLGCIRRLNLKKLQSLSRNVRDRKNS